MSSDADRIFHSVSVHGGEIKGIFAQRYRTASSKLASQLELVERPSDGVKVGLPTSIVQHFRILEYAVSVHYEGSTLRDAVQFHLGKVPVVLRPIQGTHLCVVIAKKREVKLLNRTEL